MLSYLCGSVCWVVPNSVFFLSIICYCQVTDWLWSDVIWVGLGWAWLNSAHSSIAVFVYLKYSLVLNDQWPVVGSEGQGLEVTLDARTKYAAELELISQTLWQLKRRQMPYPLHSNQRCHQKFGLGYKMLMNMVAYRNLTFSAVLQSLSHMIRGLCSILRRRRPRNAIQ